MFSVYLPPDWNHCQAERLIDLLRSDAKIIRDVSSVDVMVCGRPSAEMIEKCSPSLLLVPFAGIPPETLALARKYPTMRVHNLHHNAQAVAETAVALMLAAAGRIPQSDAALRKGDWSVRYNASRSILLGGSRVLVLGYGNIGRRVGRACKALEASVTGIVRTPRSEPDTATRESLHSLLRKTDFLVCCMPLTEETRNMIGSVELSLLHCRSVLVNVGRAGVVSEDALYSALSKREIGAAGLDVWYRPADDGMPSNLPFHELDNVVMSPHVGGAFGIPELEDERTRGIVRAVRAFVRGEPVPFPVNLDLGY